MKLIRILFSTGLLVIFGLYLYVYWGFWNLPLMGGLRAIMIIQLIIQPIFISGIVGYAWCKAEPQTKTVKIATLVFTTTLFAIIFALGLTALILNINLTDHDIVTPQLVIMQFFLAIPFLIIMIHEVMQAIKKLKEKEI